MGKVPGEVLTWVRGGPHMGKGSHMSKGRSSHG